MKLVKEIMTTFDEFEVTQEEMEFWFDIINKEVFEPTGRGAVPMPPVMATHKRVYPDWAYVKMVEVEGIEVIGLCMRPIYPNLSYFIEVLAHEMVHVWQMSVNDDTGNHNKHFYSWRDTFAEHGLTLQRLMWENHD